MGTRFNFYPQIWIQFKLQRFYYKIYAKFMAGTGDQESLPAIFFVPLGLLFYLHAKCKTMQKTYYKYSAHIIFFQISQK